jgi:hypothetical protein
MPFANYLLRAQSRLASFGLVLTIGIGFRVEHLSCTGIADRPGVPMRERCERECLAYVQDFTVFMRGESNAILHQCHSSSTTDMHLTGCNPEIIIPLNTLFAHP